jgi:hypothetical protein
MNFHVKGLGADRKKVIILGSVLVLLAVVFYFNVLAPGDDAPVQQARTGQSAVSSARPEAVGGMVRPPEDTRRTQLRPGRGGGARPEFKVGLKDKQPDPASVDPTLRLDLLAKVQAVRMAGGVRNLFQFGASPLPPKPEPKITLMGAGAPAPAATPMGPPPTPPPPPIPLKFYGYAAPAPSGAKRVFLLDGEDIIVATEGQLVKSRYKLVRVGINSIVLEDEQYKRQQTLQLEEEKAQPGQAG